jgi:hypothetical protein
MIYLFKLVCLQQYSSLVQDWKIADLIFDIISSIPHSSSWKTKKIYKSVNFCVHHIAYWAAASSHSSYSLTYFTSRYSILFCSGKIHLSFASNVFCLTLLVVGCWLLAVSFINVRSRKKKEQKKKGSLIFTYKETLSTILILSLINYLGKR